MGWNHGEASPEAKCSGGAFLILSTDRRFAFNKINIRRGGANMSLNYISEILPSLLDGTKLTLSLFFWTLIGSLPLGILVSIGLIGKFKPLKWILDL